MASIFDFDQNPSDSGSLSKEPESKKKRSKHREKLTPSELAAGRVRLADMVEKAFASLEEALEEADHGNMIKAAQIILDRAGFGPKSTVDVNTTNVDLSALSREELANRALQLAGMLKNQAESERAQKVAEQIVISSSSASKVM